MSVKIGHFSHVFHIVFHIHTPSSVSRYRHYKHSSVQNDCHINLFQWPFSFVVGKNKREESSLKHFSPVLL